MKQLLMIAFTFAALNQASAAGFHSVACVDANPTVALPLFMTLDVTSMQFRLGYMETLAGGQRTPHGTANGTATMTMEANRIILTGAYGTALLLHPTEQRNQYTGLVSGPIFAGNIKRVTNYPLNCLVK